eukprot:scaffold1810_cov96-Isochrysis_galbana.AAC.4
MKAVLRRWGHAVVAVDSRVACRVLNARGASARRIQEAAGPGRRALDCAFETERPDRRDRVRDPGEALGARGKVCRSQHEALGGTDDR